MSKSYYNICGNGKTAIIAKPSKQGIGHKEKTNLKRLEAMQQVFQQLRKKYGDVEISPATMGEEDYNRLMNIIQTTKKISGSSEFPNNLKGGEQ